MSDIKERLIELLSYFEECGWVSRAQTVRGAFDEIARLHTELQQHQWRSIESAPKDESWFWVAAQILDGTWRFGTARWHPDIERVAERGMLTTGWTHWKPFCAPPEPDQ